MHYTLLTGVALLYVTLPYLVQAATFPKDVLKTECRQRVFWIWVDQTFFGSSPWHLEVSRGTLNPDVMQNNRAAQCGYTITKDVYRNVEIRISFLGCWVKNMNDKTFDIAVQFKVTSNEGTTIYPLSMSCNSGDTWDTREIICEENYMEVSVTRIISSDLMKSIRLFGPAAAISQSWQIWFLNSSPVPISAKEAINRGYGVDATVTRVVFRAPYNTSESQIVAVGNYHLDLISSNMMYKQTLLRLIVDTTIACPNDPPVFTEFALSWLSPVVITPLVTGDFRNRQFDMGINGKRLNASEINNEYLFRNDSTTVEVTVPYGAPGGYSESDVVNNTYVTTYSIHLLLQRQWMGINEDDSTTHTAYKAITAPVIRQIPVFLDHTVKENRYFNVSLGNFYSDVTLKSFVINQGPLKLSQLTPRGMSTMDVINPNNTQVFYLTVPFSDPLVEQKYLGGYTRRYTLYVSYILTLTTKNKDFTYTDEVECVLEDAVPPFYKPSCGSDRLILDMTRGNMDLYWIPYIRNLPLTDALITSQDFTVWNRDSLFHLEVPRSAVGLVYEVATLKEFRVRLDFTLRNNRTLEVKSSFSFNCSFPPMSPVCLSNGSMIAIVDSSVTKPSFEPQKAHLKDPTCTPQEFNKTSALFNFAAYTCGTTRQFGSDYLVYENEVTFDRQVLPPSQPIISRDSAYRLTVRCRYPIRDTQWLGSVYRTASSQHGISVSSAKVLRRRARTHVAELRLARDNTFASFYQPGDYPVSFQPEDSLYFQAEGPASATVLQDCWATSYQSQDGIVRWDLIVDGLATVAESFSTEVQLSPGSSSKFQVKLEGPLNSQLYVHCKVLLCDSALPTEGCNQTEQVMGGRGVPPMSEVVSAGPIQIMAPHNEVVYQHVAGENPWSTWSWVLSLGLAVIAVLTVGAIVLVGRLLVK